MNLSIEERQRINFKLEGIFELRDLMMRVRRETVDIEKNSALTQAIDLSFDISAKYFEDLQISRGVLRNAV